MITATFTTTLNGVFLPIQLLYTGKTAQCQPHYTGFPDEFDVWHPPNYSANQYTSLKFISKIIISYIQKTRAEKILSHNHPALVIFDVFRGQLGNELLFLFLAIVLTNTAAIRLVCITLLRTT